MPSWPFSRGSTAIFCWYLWCVCVENHWPLHVWVITQLSAPASIRLFSFYGALGENSTGFAKENISWLWPSLYRNAFTLPTRKITHSRWKEMHLPWFNAPTHNGALLHLFRSFFLWLWRNMGRMLKNEKPLRNHISDCGSVVGLRGCKDNFGIN